MRYIYVLPILLLLNGCGIAASDIAIGSAIGYGLYGDEIEQIETEELKDPKTYTDAVPPQAKQGARRVADNVRDNVRHNSRKLKEWWFYDPKAHAKQAHAVPPSYCYTVMQDVVCYRQPLPGGEHRLVGYQGTGANPPPVATTEPLPTLAVNTAALPENRLVNSKPVFETIPEEVKQEKKEVDGSLTPMPLTNNAQEILPDPTLSPQL